MLGRVHFPDSCFQNDLYQLFMQVLVVKNNSLKKNSKLQARSKNPHPRAAMQQKNTLPKKLQLYPPRKKVDLELLGNVAWKKINNIFPKWCWCHGLVGGWATHLKNMLVKLDHFSK